MHGYMDEINKLTKNNSKYLSVAEQILNGWCSGMCVYAYRYTAGDDYKRAPERQRTVLTAMVQKA